MHIRLIAPLLCAVAWLAACGGSTSSGSHSTGTPLETVAGGARLACTFHAMPQEADTATVMLACAVTGAASGDTSFSVTHTVAGPKGKGTAVDATCAGPVRGGVGACSVTVTEQATEATPGTMAGKLQPSGTALGPVDPAIIP